MGLRIPATTWTTTEATSSDHRAHRTIDRVCFAKAVHLEVERQGNMQNFTGVFTPRIYP